MAITSEPDIWTQGYIHVTYTGEDHLARMRKQAKRFIDSKAHKGNHGFTGKALVAWRKQRKTILDSLRTVAKTGKLRRQTKYAPCPVHVATKVAIAAERKGKAGKYQSGTVAGRNWVAEAEDVTGFASRNESYSYYKKRS